MKPSWTASLRCPAVLARALLSMALVAPAWATASALCPVPDTRRSVRIGPIETRVPNFVARDGVCTLNDLIREDDTYADRAAWLAHVEDAMAAFATETLGEYDRMRLREAARSYDPARFTRLQILAINDFHGALRSPGYFVFGAGAASRRVPVGGAEVLAGYVDALRAKNPTRSLFVAAGDLVGASQLPSALFHDEGTVEILNRMGLDASAAGNHEFDEGAPELMRLQRGGCHPTDAWSCQGREAGTPVPFEGARFAWLAANLRNRSGAPHPLPGAVIRERDGIRVGIVGAVLESTPSVVVPAGIAGLEFLPEAPAINAEVRALRAAGAQVMVALIHEGGRPASPPVTPADLDRCNDVEGPIRNIVMQLDDAIDLVVSGHTHRPYVCAMPNRAGRLVPVTQAASSGQVLTEIDVTIDRTAGLVVAVDPRNVLVDRTHAAVRPRADVAAIVAAYERLSAPLADAVVGTIAGPISNLPNDAGLSPAGALIADAQLEATRSADASPNAGPGGAEIAFMNPGGIRASLPFTPAADGAGRVTYAQVFAMQPFGNALVTMTLTGSEIKRLLESQFPGCPNGQTARRILQPSAGFSYEWSEQGPPCDRIDPATIRLNGSVLDPARGYRVTVNDFLAEGGDRFGILTEGRARTGGPLDIDALTRYLATREPVVPALLDRIRRRR